MVVELEDGLLRTRTRGSVAVAEGRLREQRPELEPGQEHDLVRLRGDGSQTTAGLATLVDVGRPLHAALTTPSPPKSDRRPDHLKAAVHS